MSFVHLHVHTEYSLLDGAIRIDKLVEKVKSMGMNSVAITDHGNMFGVIELYKKCKKEGIKPILGCEVYVAPRSRFEKQGKIDTEPNHLILLAMNNTGYKNLVKLVSYSYTQGFYYKPRIDMDLLRQYSEGLICLSACLAGKLSRQIVASNIEGAKRTIEEFIDIFGKDRYFLELQDNKLNEQVLVNQKLVTLAREYSLGLVATCDAHYLEKSDYSLHEVLLCIQTRKNLNDEDRMTFKTNEFYIKSEEEMISAFKNIPDAIINTQKIADMCNVELTFGHTILPEFKIEENITHLEYFKRKCYEGLNKKYEPNTDIYETAKQRLEYEIKVIAQMGYIDYFLIVQDFIAYAKSVGIAVGPGRGSGAGSIAAYLIGITDIDPLKFNLVFERFLNPERVSMPDFDVDFCYERRGEVIDYVANKYGKDHVTQIITFGTMAARAAIRDVTRALDMPYQLGDKIAKLVPHELKMTIDKALNINEELNQMYEEDERVRQILDIARKLEGMVRHASTHAAGIVITKEPVLNYVPLYMNMDIVSTQFTMTTLEELGLLKMDFLGLRTLTVIEDTIKLVRKNYNLEIDFKNFDDKETFKLMCEGKTKGLFQLESPGFRQMMMKLKPDKLEDVIVMISLYRPGPMEQIPRYIANKNDPENAKDIHPALNGLLEETYGCMVYQEQVMKILQELAGYTLGRADIVRRAMSKKKIDVMNKERENFIQGCGKNNISKEDANKIFDQIAEFAKYAFNKSHAAAYAVVAYKTAYLKTHYSKEFMASLMNSMIGNLNKIPEYIMECKDMGIKVLKPDINESYSRFSVINKNIRFALSTIKNVGEGAILEIVNEREQNGKFLDFVDFCNRVPLDVVNKKCIESLIKAGCFDELDKQVNRFDLLDNFEKIVESVHQIRRNNYANQINLFDLNIEETSDKNKKSSIIKSGRTPTKKELLDMEKEVLGIYVSGHPLDEYEKYIIKNSTVTSTKLNLETESLEQGILVNPTESFDQKEVIYCGIISNQKVLYTKTNKQMMFCDIEDLYGKIEAVIFPTVFAKYSSYLFDDSVVKISGKVNIKENEKPKILVKTVEQIVKKQKIYVKLPKDKLGLEKRVIEYIKELAITNYGENPVYIFYEGTKKVRLLNRQNYLNSNNDTIDKLKLAFGKDNIKLV